jgi:predicted nucleotidyltransferase
MRDILEQKQLIEHLQSFFDRNATLLEVKMAFLYGSQAKGFPREDSDVDLAVLFADDRKSEKELFEAITKISLSLSSIVKADVNVIPIHSDFRKPMLYYNIIVKGIPVYVREYSDYLNIRRGAIDQMEDFEIFGTNWQTAIAENNLAALGYAGI